MSRGQHLLLKRSPAKYLRLGVCAPQTVCLHQVSLHDTSKLGPALRKLHFINGFGLIRLARSLSAVALAFRLFPPLALPCTSLSSSDTTTSAIGSKSSGKKATASCAAWDGLDGGWMGWVPQMAVAPKTRKFQPGPPSQVAVDQKTGIPKWNPGKWKHGLQHPRFAPPV